MVPTFTCGLVRSNFFLAIALSFSSLSPPRGSNPRPRPYQGRALPTELGGRFAHLDIKKRLLSATPWRLIKNKYSHALEHDAARSFWEAIGDGTEGSA